MLSNRLKNSFLWLLLLLAISTQAVEKTTKPAVMLAQVYHEAGVDVKQYWISEKLDGVRARWDGKQLISRGGQLFATPAWFVQGFPAEPLDGELWMARQRFEDTLSIVRKAQPHAGWRHIKFMLFDLPEHGGVFDERLKALQAIVAQAQVAHLQVIEQFTVADNAELMQRLDSVTRAGGEGLMLHAKTAEYRSGRSDDLLKLKKHQENEAVVIGYRPGKGKFSGMVGSLKVRMDDGKEFYIGSGLSNQERETPPPIGSRINFKHQGYTQRGIPRFAVYLRMRDVIEK